MCSSLIRIGVDLMGADRSPKELFAPMQHFLENAPLHYSFVFLLSQSERPYFAEIQKKWMQKQRPPPVFLFFPQTVTSEEEPIFAFKKRSESSLIQGINHLKKGNLDALISCGNTGALTVAATTQLSLLPNVKRPALLTEIDWKNGQKTILDVGANIQCRFHHLVEFALMGSTYQKAFLSISHPKIALLNVGKEENKGSILLKKTYHILSQPKWKSIFTFTGNMEPHEFFFHPANVIVTEGFTGNILLKSIEGTVAAMYSMSHTMQKIEKPIFGVRAGFFCGIKEMLYKVHGGCTFMDIQEALVYVIDQIEKKKISLFHQEWQKLQQFREP